MVAEKIAVCDTVLTRLESVNIEKFEFVAVSFLRIFFDAAHELRFNGS